MNDDGSSAGREIIPEDSSRQISLPPEMVRKGLELAIRIEGQQSIAKFENPILKLPGILMGSCISFSADGKIVAITCYGKKIEDLGWMIWNVITKYLSIYLEKEFQAVPLRYEIASTFQKAEHLPLGKRSSSISSFHFFPYLWPYAKNTDPEPTPSIINCIAISRKGNVVLLGHNDGSIYRGVIVDSVIQDFRFITRDSYHSPVTGLVFSQDDRFCAASIGDTVRLLDTVQGEKIYQAIGRNPFYNQVAFSSDDKKLLIAHGKHRTHKNINGSFMTLFDLSGEKTELLFGGDRMMDISAVAISDDNRYVVSLDQEATIAVWNAATGEEISHWSHVKSPADLHNVIGVNQVDRNLKFVEINQSVWGLSSVAISPDGKRILSGGADRCMRLWTMDGKQIAEYPHDTRVVKVAFWPDGRRALSGGWDGSVCLWELP